MIVHFLIALLIFILCYAGLLLSILTENEIKQKLQVNLEIKYTKYTRNTKLVMQYWLSKAEHRTTNPAVEILRLQEYINVSAYLNTMAKLKYFNSNEDLTRRLTQSEVDDIHNVLKEANAFIVTYPKVCPSYLKI